MIKTCVICAVEKDVAEFTNMAPHGCTCVETHFCAACILHWLSANSRVGAMSLADWRCPHCQNRAPAADRPPLADRSAASPPLADRSEIQIVVPPSVAAPTDSSSRLLTAMHQRWREHCPTYPAMTTMSEVFALPDECLTMSVDMVLHRGTYYFCFAIDQLPRSNLGYRCDVLPGDDLLAVVMTTVNERYRRFALLMDAIDHYAGDAEEKAQLLSTRNVLKLGSVLETAPRLIRDNVRHWNAEYDTIAHDFVRYIERNNPGVSTNVVSDFVDDYVARHVSRENPLYYSLGDSDND